MGKAYTFYQDSILNNKPLAGKGLNNNKNKVAIFRLWNLFPIVLMGLVYPQFIVERFPVYLKYISGF